MKDKNYILQLIKKSVSSTEPNAILILYGSYARGDYWDDSDLDLLVLVDKDIIPRQDQKRIKYPLYDIEFETGTIISPLIFSKKDWELKHKITPFYENVTREGKILWNIHNKIPQNLERTWQDFWTTKCRQGHWLFNIENIMLTLTKILLDEHNETYYGKSW